MSAVVAPAVALKRRGYSIKEVAEMHGCCERTVINLIEQGELQVRRLGRKVIIPAAAAEKLLDRDRETGNHPSRE
jgi:excisionase family DNA binding protein